MNDDPIVEEVRRARRDNAAKFNYDIDAIVRDVKTREGKDGAPVVSRPPKLIAARR